MDNDEARANARAMCERVGPYRMAQLVQIGGQIPAHWNPHVAEWMAEHQEGKDAVARADASRMLRLTALGVIFAAIAAFASVWSIAKH